MSFLRIPLLRAAPFYALHGAYTSAARNGGSTQTATTTPLPGRALPRGFPHARPGGELTRDGPAAARLASSACGPAASRRLTVQRRVRYVRRRLPAPRLPQGFGGRRGEGPIDRREQSSFPDGKASLAFPRSVAKRETPGMVSRSENALVSSRCRFASGKETRTVWREKGFCGGQNPL